MALKLVGKTEFQVGDLVTVANLPQHWRFCIIGFRNKEQNEPLAILKAYLMTRLLKTLLRITKFTYQRPALKLSSLGLAMQFIVAPTLDLWL